MRRSMRFYIPCLAIMLVLRMLSQYAAAESATALDVSPATIVLNGPHDRVQLVVTAKAGETMLDATRKVQWQTPAAACATVDPEGVVRPVADGSTALVGTLDGATIRVPVAVSGMAQPRPVSFRLEVIPILTKAGCNSGKCHGAPSGKGGFAISLRGFDWQKDYYRLTREAASRRIDLVAPADSLLIAKPTLRAPHGGGRRFNSDDLLARRLVEWIAEGAMNADDPATIALEVFPSERWLEPEVESQQLRVVARLADGSSRDVTHLAHYSASPDGKAEVTAGGLVRRLAEGEVTVAVTFADQFTTSRLAFLRPADGFVWTNPPENNPIDHLVFDRLRRLRIAPSELCDDATFLRRVWLDVCGLLPPSDEVRQFLAETSSDKRERKIDELLDRPQYADFWAMKWADRLGCNQRFVGKTGAIKYHAWIRHQIAANVPEDVFARQLLMAAGGNYGNPPASFYRLPRTPEDRAEQVAQVFLGVRIGCARCHNHPGERWTQDDYYGLAAYFVRLRYRDGPFFNHIYDKEETILPVRSGELAHARTGAVMPPKPLAAAVADVPAEADRRERLADWLLALDNPFFARAAVNRIWGQLFGRGIVEPVDDFRASNPPAHPELLDGLAADFAAHGFDRKYLIRQILRSRVYQLAAATNASNADDDRYFSHATVRLLGAEQLLDAIAQATGVPEKFSGFPLGLRAVELPDGEYFHRFLAAFGRPARALACACERDSESNLGQALELIGGEAIETQLRAPEGLIARLLSSEPASAAIIDEMFLATLSRSPSDAERAELVARLDSATNRHAAAEDILWALLNHQEFLFQH